MAQIFISYRRIDSNAITSRIYDRFAAAFGKANIFKDVDNIPLGRDFRGVLREATVQCQVMIVVIGPDWVDAKDASGNRRLNNPDDFVRIEVETGLQRDEIVVIPVLVEGAQMPSAAQLPDSMRELVYNNAFTIHDDPLFHRDMDTLIGEVRGLLGRKRPSIRWLVLAITLLTIGVIVASLILTQGSRGTTGTPTNTVTLSPSQQAITNNPTDKPDPTGAPSNTLTATPDPTLALSNTLTVTPDPTATPSNTLTATSSPTVAPSNTPKPTSTLTPTASDTPDFALLAMTYDALKAQTQTEQMIQATASKSVADTATATQWTPTFTPQITASFQAFLTQRAVSTAAQHALDLTATATLGTDTPTTTWTPSSTSTSTPSSIEILATTQMPASSGCTYTVQAGDTLYTITLMTGTTVVAMEQANPQLTSLQLQVGQVLNLPNCMSVAPTPQLTMTSMGSSLPLGFAGNPVTSNAQWKPYIDQYARTIDGIEMILVPAGCFEMGDASSVSIGDGGKQCINEPFYISRYEITNAEFSQFFCTAARPSAWLDAQRPRESINWFEASECAHKINGGRLPNEVEWEYAARGPDDLVYPWGDTWNSENAVWLSNSDNQTANVGSKPGGTSWVGAQDMTGNVWEWTNSKFYAYPYRFILEEYFSASDLNTSQRVIRGGGAVDVSGQLLTAVRSHQAPSYQGNVLGFRILVPYTSP